MSDELGRLLRTAELPGAEAAAERARRVTLAAFVEAPPRRRRRPSAVPVAVAVALAVGTGAAAATPAGEALVRGLQELVPERDPAPRAPAALPFRFPGPGRLLVVADGQAWVVAPGGARRPLGVASAARWSPLGRFVLLEHRGLRAVTPTGAVRWVLDAGAAPRAVDARWSPDGYRIAYRSGRELRLVSGSGTADQRLAADAAPTAPAWQPRSDHRPVLAWVGPDDVVRVVRTDAGGVLTADAAPRTLVRWRPRVDLAVLAWSGDGRRLAAVGPWAARVLAPDGRTQPLRVSMPSRSIIRGLEPAPVGSTAVLIRRDVDGHDALVRVDLAHPGRGGVPLYDAPGTVRHVSWSPDGRRLLIETGTGWLLAELGRPGRVRSIATPVGAGTSARIDGWCCAR